MWELKRDNGVRHGDVFAAARLATVPSVAEPSSRFIPLVQIDHSSTCKVSADIRTVCSETTYFQLSIVLEVNYKCSLRLKWLAPKLLSGSLRANDKSSLLHLHLHPPLPQHNYLRRTWTKWKTKEPKLLFLTMVFSQSGRPKLEFFTLSTRPTLVSRER